MSNPKIIIIGAGPAGIAAATRLIENGFSDITVLEAENRIGGRVNSVDFGGSVVDLGGQWVHGEKGNIVYQMVKDLNLLSPSHNNYQDNTYYLSDGTVVDKNLSDRLHRIGFDIIGDDENAKKFPGPFGNYFIQVYNERVVKEFGNKPEVLEVAEYLLDWFHKFFMCLDSAESWNDVSTTGAFKFQACEGDQQLNWRDKGYRSILYVMMKKLPDITKQLQIDDKIFLNKEVTKIIWDHNSVNAGGVTVNCADGSSYSADHVIVTVSIGVLKRFHKELFTPELPTEKVHAIENFSFGTVNKILLKFPKKWWPDDLKGFSLLWADEDRLRTRQEFPYGPKTKDGRSWLEEIYGFYVIDSHARVLLGWVVGETAKEVELMSNQMVIDGCMYLLNRFAGRKYKIPQPDDVLRSKWHSNPHFCGSYVHVGINQENRNVTAEDLAKTVVSSNSKQTILFAGEASHSTYFSTVHGAIETGYREAERLTNIYKTNSPVYHKVVILGAGMAGLGAARRLHELNFSDFVILEAQEEPGGRIRTIQVDNKALDLGAQWLHGKYNPLYEIAVKNDLLSNETSTEGLGMYIRNDGTIFNEYLVSQVDFQLGKILEECGEFVNLVDHPKSLHSFLQDRFKDYLNDCNDSLEVRTQKMELFDWHIRFQIVDNSCKSLQKLSAKYWGEYVCIDDIAHYNFKNGYKSLVDVLIEDLPIELKTEISRIEYDNKTNGQILLTSTNHEKTYLCDHLIITASLGCLKENFQIFPSLPKRLTDSINSMGYYGIGKIFLIFDYKWWKEPVQFIWSKDTCFEEDEKWLYSITGFEDVFNQPNTLLGWIGGEAVRKMESLSEEEVGQACLRLLRKFLGDFVVVPEVTRTIRTKWLSNPLVKGSYCYISTECDEGECGIDKLAEPVYVDGIPRILLAGEAVHPAHYSTTHGAFESGQSQADILHEYIKN